MNKEETIEWEETFIAKLIQIGKEKYEPCFFAEMFIKVLWELQDE